MLLSNLWSHFDNNWLHWSVSVGPEISPYHDTCMCCWPELTTGSMQFAPFICNHLYDTNHHVQPGTTSPPPLMAEQVGCGTPCLLWSLGVQEVVGSRPGRGNSKESFSSNQETGKVFSPEMPFYSKFKILKYVVPVGKCKLQTICVSLLWGIQPRYKLCLFRQKNVSLILTKYVT